MAHKVSTYERAAAAVTAAEARMNSGGRHWIKGSFRRKKEGEYAYCILGGLNAVTSSKGAVNAAAREAIADEIKREFSWLRHNSTSQVIIGFNDDRSVTWRDVGRILHRAHKRLLRCVKETQ